MEGHEGRRSGASLTMSPAAELLEGHGPPAYGGMGIEGGTKEDHRITEFCCGKHIFSHFLFSVNSMFRVSSTFDDVMHSLSTISCGFRGFLPLKRKVSVPTFSMFRHSWSPSQIHLFNQNLEDLDTLNLDLFYQNESNEQWSYLKDFDTSTGSLDHEN